MMHFPVHLSLVQQEKKNTHMRMLFVDFNLALNTIIPYIPLVNKLDLLGFNTPLYLILSTREAFLTCSQVAIGRRMRNQALQLHCRTCISVKTKPIPASNVKVISMEIHSGQRECLLHPMKLLRWGM
uniref:Uncharacterized protein n=1 Tax=Micrurus paraensis TaxID=1970185 RepID=A0A2D4K4N8_9SAUR